MKVQLAYAGFLRFIVSPCPFRLSLLPVKPSHLTAIYRSGHLTRAEPIVACLTTLHDVKCEAFIQRRATVVGLIQFII